MTDPRLYDDDSLPDTAATEGYTSASGRQALQPGAVLADKYRIVRHLGEGGMGAVYEAEHVRLGRRVALKLLHHELRRNPEALGRFITEAQAVSALQHRHIIKVEDFIDEENQPPAIVMEFVVGRTVAERAPLDVEAARALLAQVASALAAVHEAGFVHRDLKAENVMLLDTTDGAVDARVLDFGIVKLMAAQPEKFSAAKTQTGILLGTPHYMAPEVFDGKPVSNASDIYAFGVFAYVALTGWTPFDGDSVGSLAVAHMTLPPPTLATKRPGFSDPDLERLVASCMAKDPADRPASMNDIVARLRRTAAVAQPAPLSPADARALGGEGSMSRARLGIAAAGLVLVLLVAMYVAWPTDDAVTTPAPTADEVSEVVASPSPPPQAPPAEDPPLTSPGATASDTAPAKVRKTPKKKRKSKRSKARTGKAKPGTGSSTQDGLRDRRDAIYDPLAE